jgi:hypothetical protein
MRQLGPCAPERPQVRGFVDLVAQGDRVAGPGPQQIASRQRSHQEPSIIGDAEMADFQPTQAPDRAIDKGLGRDGRERLAHELIEPEPKRALSLDCQSAQQVTFGNDAGVRRREPVRRAAARRDIER